MPLHLTCWDRVAVVVIGERDEEEMEYHEVKWNGYNGSVESLVASTNFELCVMKSNIKSGYYETGILWHWRNSQGNE